MTYFQHHSPHVAAGTTKEKNVNRDEQEMALWRRVAVVEGCGFADAAVAEFRKRYPPQPSASAAVWYNEPPFPKDGIDRPCWIAGGEKPILGEVYWFDVEWRMCVIGDDYSQPLNGRRVCPIAKPPEPTP